MWVCGVRVGREKVCVLGEIGVRERKRVWGESFGRDWVKRERECVCGVELG